MSKKRISIIIAICSVILLSVTIFSIGKFSVWNPISSCFGMLEILFTNKEYTVVQNFPNRVVFSKTSDTSNKGAKKYLDQYMKNRGFEFVPEKQLGALLVYSNGNIEERIMFSSNKYYSKWKWE